MCRTPSHSRGGEDLAQQRLRTGVGRVGEHGVAGQLGGEAEVAGVGELAGPGGGGVDAAEDADVVGGSALGGLWVTFSARLRARRSGKWKFISAGASVAGVSWKTIRTPSRVPSWPVRVMSSGGEQADRAVRGARTEADPDGPGRAHRQVHAGVIHAAAEHRDAGVDVLRHHVVEEPGRRDDGHVGVRVDHAEDAAEVMDVRVGVDDRSNRAVAAVLPVERPPGRRHLGRHRRVDHDPCSARSADCCGLYSNSSSSTGDPV
jgi:hypothetical protein